MRPDTLALLGSLFNLVTFFFAFSAFCVGLYMAPRLRRALGARVLAGVVNGFLIASGALSARTFVGAVAGLGWLPAAPAQLVADLLLLGVGAGLFGSYLALERHFRSLQRQATRKDEAP